MDVKPSELILAIMQFLEILLPGAIVTYLLLDLAKCCLFFPNGPFPSLQNDGEGWVMFFIASYVLGHFIFMVASFLDELLYERLRRRRENNDQTYNEAELIRRRYMSNDPHREVINPYKWAKATLTLYAPDSLHEVRRHESDSKFFRSLVVVFICFAAVEICSNKNRLGMGCCLGLAILSFWRYYDQRWKSSQLAFQYLIARDRLVKQTASVLPAKSDSSATESALAE